MPVYASLAGSLIFLLPFVIIYISLPGDRPRRIAERMVVQPRLLAAHLRLPVPNFPLDVRS